MNIEEFSNYCLSKKATEATFPFGETTLVLKVVGKMFAIVSLDREILSASLKCDPERAEELREQHSEITPGFHLNKKHWNTVDCEGSLGNKFLFELIDHSYDMVVKGLTKKEREILSQNE